MPSPSNTPIGNPTWLSILTRLGITNQPPAWLLRNDVQPVSLVDSGITLSAVSQPPLFGTPATAGELVAPAANTRLATSGALAAGNWTITIIITEGEAAGTTNPFRLRRRNAADTADIWAARIVQAAGGTQIYTLRISVAANELIVIENVGAGGAGVTYQALIFAVAS